MNRLITRLGLEQRFQPQRLARYLLQCGLATLVVLVLLLILDVFAQTVLIAALGASTFIAFAVPRSVNADPRHMIGGYLVGIFTGVLLSLLLQAMPPASPAVSHELVVVAGALAIGLAMFLMVVTKTEHPPAAALALGLVLNEWDLPTLALIIAGIVALTLIKMFVMPLLMDLL